MIVSSLFRRLSRLCIAAFALAAAIAWADPPGRVGRITYLEGEVSFYSDADEGWHKARINYPVTGENSLWTDGRGRAEIRIGPSAIRIGDDTIFDFVNLQDDMALGFLQRGSVSIRIRQLGSLDPADNIQIETGEGRFTLEGNGRYRLDAPDTGGESRIAVLSGKAYFEGGNPNDPRLTIDAGRQLTVRASSTTGGADSSLDFRYDPAGESALDRWAQARDRQWDQTHTRYTHDRVRDSLISPYMTGYEELDAAGDWIDDSEYGRLWTPRVVVSGWAPYRYGHWSYVRPWGWTWIDDAPWGFAPFHYGRWVQVRSRWCWWPGPYIGRPVYAPALVAWIGGGSSLTIGSGPAIGWFPLAPREYYVPRYSNNPHYHRRINYVSNNITIINPPSRYRNQVPGSTIVGNNIFVGGRPIGSHVTHLPPGVVGRHPPSASFDPPRPNRRPVTEMPDRIQDGRPAPAPRPRFTQGVPPAERVQLPAPPGQQTPKFRPEASTSGPLPANRAAPEALPGGNPASNENRGRRYPMPSPAASAPAAPPRTQPQPQAHPQPQVQPQPQAQPQSFTPPSAIPRVAPLQVEPAPAMPDREMRPAPRSSGSRQRPQPEVQNATPVIAPPAAAPRYSVPQQQPVPQVVPHTAPPIAPAAPKTTPATTKTPKPTPDAQEESKNEGRGKGKSDR